VEGLLWVAEEERSWVEVAVLCPRARSRWEIPRDGGVASRPAFLQRAYLLKRAVRWVRLEDDKATGTRSQMIFFLRGKR
jgi:hypothetical protein